MVKMWTSMLAMAALLTGTVGCRVTSGHVAMKSCSPAQLVEYLRDNPEDSKIVGHVSDAMAVMAQKSAENCQTMGELGVVPAIIQAMDSLETDLWVQRFACSLVGSLISGNEGCPASNHDSLVELGIKDRVDRALAAGATDHYIQDYCKETMFAINTKKTYRTPEPSEEYRQARLQSRRDETLDRMAKRAATHEEDL